MDRRQFDSLTKRLASTSSRREALQAVSAAVVAIVLGEKVVADSMAKARVSPGGYQIRPIPSRKLKGLVRAAGRYPDRRALNKHLAASGFRRTGRKGFVLFEDGREVLRLLQERYANGNNLGEALFGIQRLREDGRLAWNVLYGDNGLARLAEHVDPGTGEILRDRVPPPADKPGCELACSIVESDASGNTPCGIVSTMLGLVGCAATAGAKCLLDAVFSDDLVCNAVAQGCNSGFCDTSGVCTSPFGDATAYCGPSEFFEGFPDCCPYPTMHCCYSLSGGWAGCCPTGVACCPTPNGAACTNSAEVCAVHQRV